MNIDFWTWLLGVISSTGLIGIVALLMRDTLATFFSKSVEHRFDKKIETFKAEVRDNEKELEQIRSFLVSARRQRDSAIESKRLEAAEILLRARHSLSQLSILVEYIKVLNTEEILKDADNPKVAEFIEALLTPLNLDEKIKLLGNVDKTLPRLYLSEKSLKAFDAYESIIFHAATMLKLLSIPMSNQGKYIKTGGLSKTVIEMVPHSKEGFDKWGESFAYQWSTYFHDEVLKALRHEVSGADDMTRDTESVQQLARDSRQAQINIRSSLEKIGLPDTLLASNDSVAASSFDADKNDA